MFYQKYYLITFIFIIITACVENSEVPFEEINKISKNWAEDIGDTLWKISETVTRRNKVIQSFENTFVAVEDGKQVLKDIANTLQSMMKDKVKAVRNIMNKAEKLARNRKPDIFPNSTFDYFDADNITQTQYNETELDDLNEYLEERQRYWESQDTDKRNNKNIISNKSEPFVERKPGAFRYVPLIDHAHFKTQVNLNFSIVRVAVNLFSREKKILNDARWSEELDITFKKNFNDDPSLTWQYFAGTNGLFRLYPAIQWSEERYDQTYDYRIRSWFTDALTSPKDVVILLDRSGSILGSRRRIVSKYIVNEILDTLNDNDFVNVYTFTNVTEPLVDCFGDNLVPANEENLRLLRESLAVYKVEFAGNFTIGFERAFQLLERYRRGNYSGAQCNQAIMLITEGIDYDYHPEIFKQYNRPDKYYRPVRVFTYLLGTEPTDGVQMEWIACANMGYYVNISRVEEVQENVLKYLRVMSRPLNMIAEKPEPLWSALYVDLADRKLSNWLWQKFEGNRQREAFVEFANQESIRLNMMFIDNSHFTKHATHEYEKYKTRPEYTYMTTVSLPVFDQRPNSTYVLGVAGVDVTRDYIKSLITSYRLGANGYAFILTNNGYLLLHPDHRTEFQNILKPTFNRVDMTEVEILDDLNEPRLFGSSIIELREKILFRKGETKLKIKSHLDNMKRLYLDTRHYYYMKLDGPFSIALALPDKYGQNTVRHLDETKFTFEYIISKLLDSKFWQMHPEWLYCKYYGMQKKFYSREEEFIYYLKKRNSINWTKIQCDNKLVTAFLKDFYATNWYDSNFDNKKKIIDLIKIFRVTILFMATHTGLTRWRKTDFFRSTEKEFIEKNTKAIDEIWYRRAVDMNYDEDKFIYSLPFHESSDYNVSDTVITASHTVFKKDGTAKAPAATIAYQFFQEDLYKLFLEVTSKQKYKCGIDILCYIVDNNGFIIVSNKANDVGKFIADIEVDTITDVVDSLVNDGVYYRTRFFDYQAICFYEPKTESPASKTTSVR